MIDKNTESARELHKKHLLSQFKEAGLRCTRIYETANPTKVSISVDEIAPDRFMQLGSLDKKVYPDYWQVYTLISKKRTQVFIQPYSAEYPLPGEHHLWLKGSFTRPLYLKKYIFGNPIWESEDKSLAARLSKRDPELKEIAKKLESNWYMGFGVIRLEWILQVYHFKKGISRLVIRTGRDDKGDGLYNFNFDSQQKLINKLEMYLMQINQPPHIPFYKPIYSTCADSILSETNKDLNLSEQTMPAKEKKKIYRDYQGAIRGVLRHIEDKSIYVYDIPTRKEKNIRKYVMPSEFSDQRIVAAFDTTMLRSGKAGMVLTPTHFFCNEGNVKISIELSDITGVDTTQLENEDKLTLKLRQGEVVVPVLWFGELATIFETIAKY